MKLTFLLALVLLSQDPDRPFPNHEMPPEGWMCGNTSKEDREHSCLCAGMAANPACPPVEGAEPPAEPPPEDSTCKVWCHKERCACHMSCDS